MLVEDESCPVYNTDNEEEESMSVYDTDIKDVIKEEEGFVRKGGIGGEEDKIEDVVVVANDICSSMIQTTLSVDVEEDINTKSHELMSHGKKELNGASFTRSRVIGRATCEKSFMNLLLKPACPRKLRIGFTFAGYGNFDIASIFPLSTSIPAPKTLWPRTIPSLTMKWHFS
ncbi:hypothetical protein Tco_1353471 [Tanacetum coccineum]